MENYRVDLQKCRTVIRTEDAVSINYDGNTTKNLFAVTITTRKKYDNLYHFRNDLYEFLKSIDYKYAVKGFMEFHKQIGKRDKAHAHGVLYYGNPPQGNKKNPFRFQVTRLNDPKVWDAYCKKDIMETLETHHNIKTGMFNYYKKPITLFHEE